jgi:hypothetical protein
MSPTPTVPPPSPTSEPPPPPPPARAVRGDGPARATAATVVAASGALLLVAAAATFLAVSWDSLGVAARVAIVGAATASAIAGGARLRRTLPAVGTVLFHLGAVLLPVDALGLALQLDATRATTWIAVGGTTLVALPVAGVVGGSAWLTGGGLIGVPVLATGLADLGVLSGAGGAPSLVALAAAGAVLLVIRDGRAAAGGQVQRLATPVLATVALVGPLVVAVVAEGLAAVGGAPLRTAAATGWSPTTWRDAATSGAIAVVALAVAAAVRRSSRLWATVPVAAAIAAIGLLLPGDAPRLAAMLPWPLLFLAVEVSARQLVDDRHLAGAAATVARSVEVVAAFAVPAIAWRAAGLELGAGADRELAAVLGLTALAWGVATTRRHPRSGGGIATAAVAAVAAAAALVTAVPSAGLAVPILAGAVVLGWRWPAAGDPGRVASAATVVVGGLAVAAAVTHALTVPGLAAGLVPVAAAAVVAGVLARRIGRHAAEDGAGLVAAVVLLPTVALAVAAAGLALGRVSPDVVAQVGTVGLALGCAALADRQPTVADLLRVLAAAVAVLVPAGELVGTLDGATLAAPACVLLAGVMTVETVRTGRRRLSLLVGPALVQAVAGVAWSLTASRPTTGAVLLLLAVAVLPATTRTDLRAAVVTTAVLAGVPGVALLSVSPLAVAWAMVVLGLATVAAGAYLGQPVVTHAGGVVATLGVWQLLGLTGVTATDVWVAPLALHLWLTASRARRAGTITSWAADVPPLLLITVPAVAERLAGGGGWHAAFAGTLALVAVAAGGAWRHGGPLVVGVGVLVAVVLVETVAVVAAVPTWGWLAAGGIALVGVAVVIERTGGAPVHTVRRVREVVAERFD